MGGFVVGTGPQVVITSALAAASKFYNRTNHYIHRLHLFTRGSQAYNESRWKERLDSESILWANELAIVSRAAVSSPVNRRSQYVQSAKRLRQLLKQAHECQRSPNRHRCLLRENYRHERGSNIQR